ncbi:DNA-processing protein DprA [Desulfosporosinus sp.]|uniref:DNA-processing protein DprA n=1 Tax=Desulfosporosinus sp. TaxID=157907 RepID=UPI0025C4D33D|nr:DNA-processing protein DprA [Desulfosporosinus sp.]MBC2722497.1 DNA-protecting protein DprA [Desulfosporosinus sp.]MBC2728278.1 DNA-protecting protein DprA [Desulfosporosinus sp.]
MGIEQEKIIRAAFRTISKVGSQRLRLLIAYFGSALKAWEAPASKYLEIPYQERWIKELITARQSIDPERITERLIKQGIQIITPEEIDYPHLLAELSDAPPLLYYRGQLKGNIQALAIVGSRKATAYGKAVAKMLARDAAAKEIVITSGLARGIDTAAHQGAIDAGGVTWAFLGCGLDQIYPRENQRLAETIIERGALISEFAPGSPPNAAHFPARNRLISGCSRGVVVVEAAERSGALITVDFALEQGREVFAVPGPIFSEVSKGSHNLLRQGAKIVEGIDDICKELPAWSNYVGHISLRKEALASDIESSNGVKDYDIILGLLSDVPLHIDKITINSNLPVSAVSLGLLELQLAGKVIQLPGQHYVLARER